MTETIILQQQKKDWIPPIDSMNTREAEVILVLGNGWRTLILNEHEALSLADECIVIKDNTEVKSVPLCQIRDIVFTSCSGSVTVPLLVRLSECGIGTLFCDTKRLPKCMLNGLNVNIDTSGRQMNQAAWTDRKKKAVWNRIVSMKIGMQESLLRKTSGLSYEKLEMYRNGVHDGDADNAEAIAARVYFSSLFGKEFVRFAEDDVNAALNYGYAVMMSAFARIVTIYGYSTAVGIHHCNRQNSFNFPCDLMEPFRPFVDETVYRNRERELDSDYKNELITVNRKMCRYAGKKMTVADAMECYTLDVCKAMNEPRAKLKGVEFAE